MTAQSDTALQDTIIGAETQVWQALVTGDATADEAALCDSFLGVYPDGFANKADHVAQLAGGPTIKRFRISDPRVRALGTEHAFIAYRADFCRTGRQKDEVMFITSIWQKQQGHWRNIHSQDTPA